MNFPRTINNEEVRMIKWHRRLFDLLWDEVRQLIANPHSLRSIFKKGKLSGYFHYLWIRLKYQRNWVRHNNIQGLKVKQYHSYEDYLAHQPTKMQFLDLQEIDRKLRASIPTRVADLPIWDSGTTVLCLGARGGGEVQAFLDLGCFAVGIDLEPGKKNLYVLYGDFHSIQFPNETVDIVYFNALDHAFDIPKVISEIKRVLKPKGHLVLELPKGSAEGTTPQLWESVWWATLDDVLKLFKTQGFTVLSQRPYARLKEQVCFKKAKARTV